MPIKRIPMNLKRFNVQQNALHTKSRLSNWKESPNKKKWTILVQSNLETDSIKFDPVYAKPSKKKTTKKLGNNPVLWINWTPTEGGLVWPLALPLGRGRFLGLSFIGGRRFLWFISLARPGECVFFYFFFLLFFFFFLLSFSLFLFLFYYLFFCLAFHGTF